AHGKANTHPQFNFLELFRAQLLSHNCWNWRNIELLTEELGFAALGRSTQESPKTSARCELLRSDTDKKPCLVAKGEIEKRIEASHRTMQGGMFVVFFKQTVGSRHQFRWKRRLRDHSRGQRQKENESDHTTHLNSSKILLLMGGRAGEMCIRIHSPVSYTA